MTPRLDPTGITFAISFGFKIILKEFEYNCLSVHLSSNTTLQASIPAYYERIAFRHTVIDGLLEVVAKFESNPTQGNIFDTKLCTKSSKHIIVVNGCRRENSSDGFSGSAARWPC